MKHLDVFDFPSMTAPDSVAMRKSLINFFNAHRDSKDSMLGLQQMLTIALRKTNECLQEHEVDPRTASGRRLQKREMRDAAVAVSIPVEQPVQVAPIVVDAQPKSIVGMATTGAAQQTLEVPSIEIPQLTNV